MAVTCEGCTFFIFASCEPLTSQYCSDNHVSPMSMGGQTNHWALSTIGEHLANNKKDRQQFCSKSAHAPQKELPKDALLPNVTKIT